MTQSSPTVLLYGQAVILMEELQEAVEAGLIKTKLEVDGKLQDILSRYLKGAGIPLTGWNPVDETEPPLSAKMNRFWRQVQADVALMQHQVDLLRSSSIFVHNFLTTEIQKSVQQNAVLRNKIKTLQLYSDSVDSSIVIFSDNFHTDDNIDANFVTSSSRVNIESSNFLTLGRLGEYVNLASIADVKVLTTSNGFAGNNQEVYDPVNAQTNPTTNEKILKFIAEQARSATLSKLLDGSPSTWYEYEAWQVSDADRETAKNFNFKYAVNTADGVVNTDWSVGPTGNTLKLDLEFNLGQPQKINQIVYTPYGLTDNLNLPVKVSLVEISADGTVWTPATPTNVWVGTDVNANAARAADNVTTRQMTWTFQEQVTKFIRMHLEQPNFIKRPMGHVYWVNKTNTAVRVEGPHPKLAEIDKYYAPNNSVSGNLVQKREWFPAKRWAIGIRDIAFEQIRYQVESTMVTKPIRAGGVIDRIALEAEIYIPPDFDSEVNWIKFYISPDNGTTWHQISRIQDDFLSIPEIIAYNDPTPLAFHEPGVGYYNVSGEVTALRLKIVMSRPSDLPASTPIIRSYRLKIKRR